MESLGSVILGFQISLQPVNIAYCFIGVLIGTLIGVLPGIGPVGAMAILLPTTFHLSPISSLIMLAGIYYGSMYGGSTTSILVNIPGEAASVVTCLDGYQMARQGKAGRALGISAFGSFIAGTVSVVMLMAFAYPLSRAALRFGPPEYFSLVVLGLILVSYLSHSSFIKSMIMATLGLVLSFCGLDMVSGQVRFTCNVDELLEGVGIAPLVMGLFGIGEILYNLEDTSGRSIFKTHVKGILPSLKDWADSAGPISRGTVLGFLLGILPGGGAILASFVSYVVEKRVSRHPETFGEGAIQGVAGPEAANNAASSGAFIPLLTLGLPSNVVMAVLYSGLLIHGLTPGPLLLKEHPDVFWGIITSMYVGNVMLLILNLPLIGLWIRLLSVPFRLLFPLIIMFCLIGVYSVNNSVVDIGLMILFGVFGYIARKGDFECAPLVLAFVLGPMLEQAMRQSLMMSNGSFAIFLLRPISGVCLAMGLCLLIISIVSHRKRRAC